MILKDTSTDMENGQGELWDIARCPTVIDWVVGSEWVTAHQETSWSVLVTTERYHSYENCSQHVLWSNRECSCKEMLLLK